MAQQQIYMSKLFNIFLVCVCLSTMVSCLPFKEKIALLNSLQVGRKEEPIEWGCKGCDQETQPIHSYVIEEPAKDVKAILSVYDDYTVLAFRYTATLKNVWQDIIYAKQTQDEHAPKGAKVQREYDRMWNSIRDYTLDDLQAHSHTGHLIITGISLGGGLADLSFVDIQHHEIFDTVEVITFGAPKVGNKKWANWFNTVTDSVRLYLKNDPIPKLPICFTPICNYRQAGQAYVCRKKTQVCVSKKSSKYEELIGSSTEDLVEMMQEIRQYSQEGENGFITGLYDHIYNYPILRDFTLVN